MTSLTAGELFTLIRDEEERQLREEWRQYVNPIFGETLRDFETQSAKAMARAMVRDCPSLETVPAMFDTERVLPQLKAVPTSAEKAAAWSAARNACKPLDGFRRPPPGKKRWVWRHQDRAALLFQYEALVEACGKASAALVELHERWGYAKPKSDKGGGLSKVLTMARQEHKMLLPRRAIKAGR